MSQTSLPQKLSEGDYVRLRSICETHREMILQMLDLQVFSMRDIDVGDGDWRAMVRQLKSRGAIYIVGDEVIEHEDYGQDIIRRWRWKPGARQFLREYATDRESLPCGHRPHIYHRHDGSYGCRYCQDDREFSREVVEAVMF